MVESRRPSTPSTSPTARAAVAGGLEKTSQELERTAVQVAGIAVELNAVAKDQGGNCVSLKARGVGLRAEADRPHSPP